MLKSPFVHSCGAPTTLPRPSLSSGQGLHLCPGIHHYLASKVYTWLLPNPNVQGLHLCPDLATACPQTTMCSSPLLLHTTTPSPPPTTTTTTTTTTSLLLLNTTTTSATLCPTILVCRRLRIWGTLQCTSPILALRTHFEDMPPVNQAPESAVTPVKVVQDHIDKFIHDEGIWRIWAWPL